MTFIGDIPQQAANLLSWGTEWHKNCFGIGRLDNPGRISG